MSTGAIIGAGPVQSYSYIFSTQHNMLKKRDMLDLGWACIF